MESKTIKLLLLEDDTAHAEAILRALKSTRYKVRVAGTLREYHESVAADPPDIALLDMFLPDGGAMEVLSSHQQANPFPLLIMTSHGNEQHAVDAMKAGALDYIVKSPEAFADMPGIITHALDHWKLLQERKWGEEELRKSELRYHDLVNNSKNAVAIYEAAADGEDFIIKDFNGAAENIEKVKKEDIIGKSVILVFPGVKEFGFFAVFQRVWRTGVPEHYPITQYRDERISGWRDSYVYKLYSGEIVAIYEDVTERKQAEEVLQREQTMLARTEAIAHIGSWEWDIATDTVTWSEELFRIFQRDPQEGAPGFASQSAFYHPDDFALLRQAVEAAVANGTTYALELRAIRKDGEIRVCMARGAVEMAPGGRPARLVGSLQDITERKKAELALLESNEKFSKAFLTSPDSVGITRLKDGVCVAVNKSFTRLMGFEEGEIVGKSVLALNIWANPSDRQRMVELLKAEGAVESFEALFITKTGTLLYGLMSAAIIELNGESHIIHTTKDITEYVQAQNTLRESEEKYRTLVEKANEAIVIVQDDVFVFANPKMANLLGVPDGHLIGKPFTDFIWPEDRELVVANYRKRLGGGAISDAYDFRFITTGGKPVWVFVSAAVIQWKGKPATLNLLTDITERKQAEAALRESEAQYRLLSEHTTDVVVLMDTNLKILYVSPSVQQLRGFTPQEIVEMPLDKQFTPESLKMAYEVFSGEIAKSLSDPDYNPIITLELEQYRKDGTTYWAESKFSVIWDESGKPLSILAEARDISERKKMEEALRESEGKYRMVVENAQEAIFIAVDGMIKFANSRAIELSGYSMEEFRSMPFIEFFHPDDRQMIAERYLRWLEGKDVPTTDTVRIIVKRGDIRWAEFSIVAITWEGRHATLGFLADITDRKNLEEERQRVDKLESIGVLAGGIAHDFNNILTAILGNISLAGMEAAPGSELQNSLEQAEKAALRAKYLTAQLLTFSKGGAPVVKLSSLTALLKDTARFALHGSNVKCRFSIPAGLWHAEIDTGQVSQVIHNLVINAQQAMPAGGTIELTAENMAVNDARSLGRGLPVTAGDYVRVSVADHGTGIPGENLEKIFDPFFTTKQQGNGLGLATSFSIARQHGGHISVESIVGSGSTFYLYLPASTETAASKQAKTVARRTDGKAKILVMDDEKGVREIAGRMLKHIGYEDVEFAADGAEAIERYKAAMKSGNPFTVAILDLTIAGGMGGEVAIQKLLKIDPGVKAIVSSGYIDDSVIAKFRDYGFSGMVAKPYTLEELGKALQDVIG